MHLGLFLSYKVVLTMDSLLRPITLLAPASWLNLQNMT